MWSQIHQEFTRRHPRRARLNRLAQKIPHIYISER